MQLLWTPNSPVACKLQSMLSEQFEYMKDRRKHIDIRHEHAKLPIEMQREFSYAKQLLMEHSCYILMEITHPALTTVRPHMKRQ